MLYEEILLVIVDTRNNVVLESHVVAGTSGGAEKKPLCLKGTASSRTASVSFATRLSPLTYVWFFAKHRFQHPLLDSIFIAGTGNSFPSKALKKK